MTARQRTAATALAETVAWRQTMATINWWSAPWEEIRHLEVLPGTRLDADNWQMPHKWLKKHNVTSVDFTRAQPEGWARTEECAEMLQRRLRRLAAADFHTTVRPKATDGTRRVPGQKRWARPRVSRPGKLGTWAARQRNIIVLARALAERDGSEVTEPDVEMQSPDPDRPTCPDGVPLFAPAGAAYFEGAENPISNHARRRLIGRLNALYSAGQFDDWPSADVAQPSEVKDPGNVTKPFADEETTVLCRAAFILGKLQDDLLDCARAVMLVKRRQSWPDAVRAYRSPALQEGTPLPLTVRLGLNSKNGPRLVSRWPLADWGDLLTMLSHCQAANFLIYATATGARKEEIESLDRDPLLKFIPKVGRTMGRLPDGRMQAFVEGWTLKGETIPTRREWALPLQAVAAIRRQQRIADLLDPDDSTLWVSTRFDTTKGREVTMDSYLALRTFAESICLTGETPIGAAINGKVHPQRFRETMARLVGLALDHGHHVLYDVLGHRELNITLGYLMADPEFATEVERTRREAEAVRSRRLIARAGVLRGPAAENIRRRLALHLQPGQTVDDLTDRQVKTIVPAAAPVWPAKFCAALSTDPGLCSDTLMRDRTQCKEKCPHFLKLPEADDDRRDAIQDALADIAETPPSHLIVKTREVDMMLEYFEADETLLDEVAGDPRLPKALSIIVPATLARVPPHLAERLVVLRGGRP